MSPANDGPEFPLIDSDERERSVEYLKEAIDVAAEAGSSFLNVIPGRRDDTLDPAQHHLLIVAALREVAPRAERAGVILLVEPINIAVDYPGIYLSTSYEEHKIVDAVDSEHVELLFDVYHEQIGFSNVIENIHDHVDLISYVHVADVPGRREPSTGEINYPNVLQALADAGYDEYVGAEFVPMGEPETAIRTVRAMLEEIQ